MSSFQWRGLQTPTCQGGNPLELRAPWPRVLVCRLSATTPISLLGWIYQPVTPGRKVPAPQETSFMPKSSSSGPGASAQRSREGGVHFLSPFDVGKEILCRIKTIPLPPMWIHHRIVCVAAAQPLPHCHLPLQGVYKEIIPVFRGVLIDKIPLNSSSLQWSTGRAPNYSKVYFLP